MEENLNLIQKLAKIRAMSDVVSKDKKGYNYKYSDITAILANITAGMKKYGVSLIPCIVPQSTTVCQNAVTNTKIDKATSKPFDQVTTEMIVTADMIFKWVNDDDTSDFIEVPWFLTGSQADPSQAFGSGLTYCTRYFLTTYFQIAQADSDVDSYRTKQKEAEEYENKVIAESIINEFNTTVAKYLSDHQDMSDDVKRFLSRFAKNGNYFTIKDPVIASKLVEEFNDKYIKGE